MGINYTIKGLAFLFCILLLIDCLSDNRHFNVANIRIEEWKESTLNFIKDSCNYGYDSLRLGEIYTPMVKDSIIYLSESEYLRLILKDRNEFILKLKDVRPTAREISIIERYNKGNKNFIALVNSRDYYAFKFVDDDLVELYDHYNVDKYVKERFENGVGCFSDHFGVPQNVVIQSNWDPKLQKLVPVYVYLGLR